MSHRGHERDRRDDRRRDYGSSRPSERYDSSRRDGPNTRDGGGRSERRRSRSRSPRRHDGKDRDERRRSRSRSPQRHRSREREHGSKRRDDRRDDRKSDKRDERDKIRETNGHEADESGKRQKLNLDRNDANNSMQVDPQNGEQGEEVNEEAMMAMMGFSGFTSTKGQEVEGNQQGGVKINKQRTWRQYMNRRGGFNRPLDRVK